MLKSMNVLINGMAIVSLCGALAACQKNDSAAEAQKGPAEQAGKQLDQAAAKAAVEINKVAEQAGKGLQKAGESLQDKAKEAQAKDKQKKILTIAYSRSHNAADISVGGKSCETSAGKASAVLSHKKKKKTRVDKRPLLQSLRRHPAAG